MMPPEIEVQYNTKTWVFYLFNFVFVVIFSKNFSFVSGRVNWKEN